MIRFEKALGRCIITAFTSVHVCTNTFKYAFQTEATGSEFNTQWAFGGTSHSGCDNGEREEVRGEEIMSLACIVNCLSLHLSEVLQLSTLPGIRNWA